MNTILMHVKFMINEFILWLYKYTCSTFPFISVFESVSATHWPSVIKVWEADQADRYTSDPVLLWNDHLHTGNTQDIS